MSLAPVLPASPSVPRPPAGVAPRACRREPKPRRAKAYRTKMFSGRVAPVFGLTVIDRTGRGRHVALPVRALGRAAPGRRVAPTYNQPRVELRRIYMMRVSRTPC